MAMRRPYRQPQAHEAIMDVLYREAGTKYDPDLLASFATMIADSEHKAMPH
jgi:response regulator RpfG family c-di-GMP phosphodiesterase